MDIQFYKSSIEKKQFVAVSGLLLIFFVVGHLAGNLILFLGPDAYNAYAEKMSSLRPELYVVEALLLLVFISHLYMTALIVYENIQARGQRYLLENAKSERSLASRMMPYTGLIILAFVIWHLLDFTFIDRYGERSILPDGISYGLYGVVYNSFSEPIHVTLYIIAMVAVGMHLSHGIQSFFQTFGLMKLENTQNVKDVSKFIGAMIAIGFSLIPIYVLLDSLKY